MIKVLNSIMFKYEKYSDEEFYQISLFKWPSKLLFLLLGKFPLKLENDKMTFRHSLILFLHGLAISISFIGLVIGRFVIHLLKPSDYISEKANRLDVDVWYVGATIISLLGIIAFKAETKLMKEMHIQHQNITYQQNPDERRKENHKMRIMNGLVFCCVVLLLSLICIWRIHLLSFKFFIAFST